MHILYTTDYDGRLPDANKWFIERELGGYGFTYRDIHGVTFCPSDNGNPDLNLRKGVGHWDASYALIWDINRVDPGEWAYTYTRGHRNLNRYKDPSLKIAFFEQIPTSSWKSSWGYWYFSWSFRDMRHYNGHNLSFMDGHAAHYNNPLLTIDARWWLSTPGDWRYGSGKPTDKTLTAYNFLNVESDGDWWFRWWNQHYVADGGGFE